MGVKLSVDLAPFAAMPSRTAITQQKLDRAEAASDARAAAEVVASKSAADDKKLQSKNAVARGNVRKKISRKTCPGADTLSVGGATRGTTNPS